ncbi:DUF5316 domain-containing protein [Rossellomorea aquimaris]|uniref:Uncharacterized protein n=1 Tax=Rossellomorea aquimaris TaxID=189382 RepID=A0A5D4TXD7_9BACI|nr:DUF5316 domain-containing protein [Rossellomorea aquimaris]TYS79694.1 hypothetical protein FZC80_08590 [Rossellomorea aquimaris]
MKKVFFISILSAFLFFLAGSLTRYEVITFVCGGIGLLGLAISGIFSGAFISGNQIRANTSTESKEERKKRVRVMTTFALLGFPHFVAAIGLTLLS